MVAFLQRSALLLGLLAMSACSPQAAVQTPAQPQRVAAQQAVPNAGYFSTAILTVRNPAEMARTLASLQELKRQTRQEPGNVDFLVHQDLSDPRRILLWEHFRDETAFQQHLASEHLTHFLSLNLVDFEVGYSTRMVA